jgi:hypothetical protein
MEKKLQENNRQRRRKIMEEGKDINEFFWHQLPYKPEYEGPQILGDFSLHTWLFKKNPENLKHVTKVNKI